MRVSRFVVSWRSVGVGLGLLLASACHREPKAGDSCKPTDVRCVDGKTELACQAGTFLVTPCKGPMGCREDQKTLTCDTTGNAEGDPCSTSDEGSAQCIGDKQRVTCRAGKYTIDACRGPEGCRSEGGSIRCDQSRGQVGDRCRGSTNACSLDGKSVLTCRDDRLGIAATCPGEGGCSVSERKVNCDLGEKKGKAGPP